MKRKGAIIAYVIDRFILRSKFEKQLEDANAQGFREAIKEMGKVKGSSTKRHIRKKI